MDVLSHSRRIARRAKRTSSAMALLGCTHCGYLSEGETEGKVGHLTNEACPECRYAMRIVDLTEAQQLTRERFLAAHWEELAVFQTAHAREEAALDDAKRRFETQQQLPTGLRRPALQRNEFDSDPRQLRDNLRTLEALLADCEAPIRRRILLMFGELVSSWQGRFAGESISVVIEVLVGSVRVSVRNSNRHVTPAEWTELISARVAALVDAWGIDRRLAGRAWFEFQ
jgi:hypothetical protein